MVRGYRKEPVPENLVEKLLQNAHQAPSAGFLQPQEFIVVRDGEMKRRLAAAALHQTFVAEAPLVIVVCSDTRRQTPRYGRRGYEFYSITDGAFASMLILLTVVDEGLGACFVGAFDDAKVSRVLGLPEGVRPIGIISIGYPAEGARKLRRIPLEKIMHFDRW